MRPAKFNLDAELTVRVGDELLANSKRIALLRQIDQIENLTKAAKLAGYSYKGAWDSIQQMSELSGGTLLERQAGGKGGGRTKLTERGKQLLKNFSLIQTEHQRFIARLDKLANGLSADYAALTEIPMKTSARNQFAGVIASINQGPVHDEIDIRLHEHLHLTASITHESSRELQLEIGAKVFALIKASMVHVATEDCEESSVNNFSGIAKKIITGKNYSEIILAIEEGIEIVATIPNTTKQIKSIQAGDEVSLWFDPSNVILGIAA
jgi:molybdate transport system regulatory protein